MDRRGLSSISHGLSESKTDERLDAFSTFGDEGRADGSNNNQEFRRQRSLSPPGFGDSDGQLTQDDSSSKSRDGSDQQQKIFPTDTEEFTSSTKTSNDEKSTSGNDDKSTDGRRDKSSGNGGKYWSDNERSNEYNDENNASASSSDSDTDSVENHYKGHQTQSSDFYNMQPAVAHPPPPVSEAPDQAPGQEVIDLLSSEATGEVADAQKTDTFDGQEELHQAKKQRTDGQFNPPGQQPEESLSTALAQHNQSGGTNRGQLIQPGRTLSEAAVMPQPLQSARPPSMYPMNQVAYERPVYINIDSANPPTWRTLLPSPVAHRKPPPSANGGSKVRRFKLSLLNVNEFTIAGMPLYMDGPPTPVTNLRTAIRQISRDHGKAVFERDKNGNGGGKWRIPLGAYQAFVGFLKDQANTYVEGIPQHQLQIASLEKARQDKGYPEIDEVIRMGVPTKLALALAPFQRGGVDFVHEKGGRALIADDMGLGKTIQGIASMSMYSDEWPLLVLCPSSARYHWASECRKWLARSNNENTSNGGIGFDHATMQNVTMDRDDGSKLLDHDQVVVLTSSRDPILPHRNTRVVVCSYGLAPTLISTGKITAGLFRCAIVDESHMLKNKSAKRTLALVPILRATTRCLLLSGTPALARPAELWPQLESIGTEQHGWWEDEREFMDKYAKNASAEARAELHTLLVGTVMIRRLKPDILKTLPQKIREKASVKLLDKDKRAQFNDLLLELKDSKGALGKIARKHDFSSDDNKSESEHVPLLPAAFAAPASATPTHQSQQIQELLQKKAEAERMLHEDIQRQLHEGHSRIQSYLESLSRQFPPSQLQELRLQQETVLRNELEKRYKETHAQILSLYAVPGETVQEDEEANERKTLLSRLYALTGDVKVPLMVDMLEKWFNDPTKGKVCIFAHHLSVLDAIGLGAKLSNDPSSTRKFIRIDGSTSPKLRQQQIDAFQNDPTIRVAILGITAAGVAVTLTASSTVWFAELFWTPALMIQAEDRVHRIGQASQVRCLYVVARGTLDDVLWKLIEKKFQDLGEFVEGKEKLKIVVNKTYNNTKELFSMFQSEITGFDLNDEDNFLDDINFSDEDIEREIEDFAAEETNMVKDEGDGDDDDENVSANGEAGDQKRPAIDTNSSTAQQGDALGATEEAAITLSSGEESEGENQSGEPGVTSTTSSRAGSAVQFSQPIDAPLADCRMYRVTFPGHTIGVDICEFGGRILVDTVSRERRNRLGPDCKPAIGDVFVAINQATCPLNWPKSGFRAFVQQAFSRPPVRVLFAEVPSVREEFLRYREERETLRAKRKEEEKERRRRERVDPSNIIEIDD